MNIDWWRIGILDIGNCEDLQQPAIKKQTLKEITKIGNFVMYN